MQLPDLRLRRLRRGLAIAGTTVLGAGVALAAGVPALAAAIAPGKSFLDIRSWYKNDPGWPKVQTYLDGGAAPTFNYHRFWAQVEVATGYADSARLFPNG